MNSKLVLLADNKHIEGEIQCVGFARNWLEVNRGVTFSQVVIAFDIWKSINSYKRLIDGVFMNVHTRLNGSRFLPCIGDLIIYHRDFFGTGHVAVVKKVDKTQKTVSVIEKNYMDYYQELDQQRQIPFTTDGKNYWLQEQHILGWKHINEFSNN
jgi:glutathionylspermidine amidase/synthetase